MNKHDVLIKAIERTIRCVPEYEDRQPGLDALTALADEYEKLREIHDRLEIFLQTEIEAAEWLIRRNERRPSNVEQDWYVQQAYKNILLRLKSQQSGEEGE